MRAWIFPSIAALVAFAVLEFACRAVFGFSDSLTPLIAILGASLVLMLTRWLLERHSALDSPVAPLDETSGGR